MRDTHGKGLGCDICKPAVASILASIHNDYILEPEHVGLQDSNGVPRQHAEGRHLFRGAQGARR